jgi:hypothetical protein
MSRFSFNPILACVALILPLVVMPVLADEEIGVVNSGFEAAGAANLPDGWTLETELPSGVSLNLDPSVKHSGRLSLAVMNASPASVTLTSQAVELQIGHLYRLSGWLKTENALSDPTSQFPTAVPACLTMLSFPFTNYSPAVGATSDWRRIEVLFIATKKKDSVKLHFGFNGTATGRAWFDDIKLEMVDDISSYIPLETVSWFGPAYRYDDRGWIFVHIEGEPYERGYQFGYLLTDEVAEYLNKLAIRENRSEPRAGWDHIRFIVQAFMLNRYEEEYQIEMKGIADGASYAGARFYGRPLDVVDIAGLNSVIDIGQMYGALRNTPNATSGINFLKHEDELLIKEEYHKCSGVTATGSATDDGRIVFGQIFMWNGYTGIHWDVICDLQPTRGHRLVYHTFPGGIHSGSDFYINDAGLIVGETTTAQTPYDDSGTPQSNRIRKAMQYSDNIDDLVKIMTHRNNGQYTNEWPFAEAKSGEVGIFLLGTHKWRLWRSSQNDFPAGLTDFYWCNNNNKDLEVRKEYIVNADNAPYDLMFRPWNRDLAFNEFYHQNKGKIDSIAVANLWASSPINRSHACDGKITTGDMADQLVFLAHYGKLTLRHKWVGGRFIADLPGAEPHLSLGYSTPSPIFVTDKLHALGERARKLSPQPAPLNRLDLSAVADNYNIGKRALWRGTAYPASQAESWLISGSPAYWQLLKDMPGNPGEAAGWLGDELAGLNCTYLYTISREEDIVPLETVERFDAYRFYQLPRIKGTFALHQLRLLLGNALFLKMMDEIYGVFAGDQIATGQFIAAAEETSGKPVRDFIMQWIDRKGLPDPEVKVTAAQSGTAWKVAFTVTQKGEPYHLLGSVDIDCGATVYRKPFETSGPSSSFSVEVPEKPIRAVFNSGNDFPVARDNFYLLSHFFEDFQHTLIVYGTARQIEANHSLALQWQEKLADVYSEILPPLRKDCEITRDELASHDLFVIGEPSDNTLMTEIAGRVESLEVGRNWFRWRGELFARHDDGMVIVLPNPWNASKVLYLFVTNSAMQLYHMTRNYERGIPSWAVYKGEEIVRKGYHPIARYLFNLN